MDIGVISAINEVVSKLNELRSDMRELIGTIRQQNRPYSQFQQAQPFQPQIVFGQQPQPISDQPYGYNGTPPPSRSTGAMISFNSRQMIKQPITNEEIARGLCTSRNELKELSIVILNIEIATNGDQVTIIMGYPPVNNTPDLSSKIERLAHYIHTTLFGTDKDFIVRYNSPLLPPAATYR